MQRIVLDKDIRSLSDFRSNVSIFLNQVHNTKRPIVITQHGKSAAILLDVSEYEKMVEKLELIQDIETAIKQIDENRGINHKQAIKRLKERASR